MDRRLLILILIAGVALALVSGFANTLNIGNSPNGFGWKQGVGLGVGVVVALAALVMLVRRPGGTPPGPPPAT